MYELRILDPAAKALGKLDKPTGRRIVKRLNWLSENVDQVRLEQLGGDLSGLFKLRVGDYRILYEVISSEDVIVVHLIGHRREVYR